jgi:hypothetical protein
LVVTFVFLALADGARATEDSSEPDFGHAMENVKEVAYEARLTLVGPGSALVTVTRTFEARDPSAPVALYRGFDLPGDAVVTSFELETDGKWRPGRLRRDRPIKAGGGLAPLALARDGRPWAALEWMTGGQSQIETSMFRVRGRFAVRYTLSSRGDPIANGHRWVFCPEGDDAPPDVVAAARPSTPGVKLEVRPYDDVPSCREVVSTEPPPETLATRYACYRLGPKAWWWRIELRAPASLLPAPPPPEPGPVVFVLDASRSQESRGGLPTQLAIVRAFLANAPNAEVELLLVGRTAERVLGRLVPASELERALPADLVRRPLGNGSFLERGAALAADILAREGRPGRVVLLTDGELRSAFNRRDVIASIRRAPAGTVVHLLYPGNWGGNEVSPLWSEETAEIGLAFGGSSYQISVAKKAQPGQPGLAAIARRLVWPEHLEGIELHDVGRRGHPEWPRDPTSLPFAFKSEVEAGAEESWSDVSPTPPPTRLALTGQIWSRKVELRLRPDAALARELPRLATADDHMMNCEASGEHRSVALAGGFLAPGLVFWVPGTGDAESIGVGSFDFPCSDGISGGRSGFHTPELEELPRALLDAMSPCGLVVRPDGGIVAKIETQHSEILDVAVEGAGERQRQCAEEALWNVRLPEKFNQRRWWRQEYKLGLAIAPAADGGIGK